MEAWQTIETNDCLEVRSEAVAVLPHLARRWNIHRMYRQTPVACTGSRAMELAGGREAETRYEGYALLSPMGESYVQGDGLDCGPL